MVLLLLLAPTVVTATKLPASWYQEPTTGSVAQIRFQLATPYLYRNKKPFIKEKINLKRIIGTYQQFNAVLYKNAAHCIDFQVFDLEHLTDRYVKIPAEEMLTFKISPYTDTSRKNVWCPNQFSFIAEAKKKYSVKLDIFKQNSRNAQCRVRVFIDENPIKQVKIVARTRPVKYLTSRSYRCAPIELLQPKWQLESRHKFECTLKNGLFGC